MFSKFKTIKILQQNSTKFLKPNLKSNLLKMNKNLTRNFALIVEKPQIENQDNNQSHNQNHNQSQNNHENHEQHNHHHGENHDHHHDDHHGHQTKQQFQEQIENDPYIKFITKLTYYTMFGSLINFAVLAILDYRLNSNARTLGWRLVSGEQELIVVNEPFEDDHHHH
eukprot:TRINITY_DN1648_c0_g2_i1.p1 TRINITY_DN1648_c0_g2~~TRINITY_DN1648_c0_g2_i1.p1  ORF type:complete len:183 (-),score=52.15 TRINITY_DN1648_c0_g2_i1:117-620(-)